MKLLIPGSFLLLLGSHVQANNLGGSTTQQRRRRDLQKPPIWVPTDGSTCCDHGYPCIHDDESTCIDIYPLNSPTNAGECPPGSSPAPCSCKNTQTGAKRDSGCSSNPKVCAGPSGTPLTIPNAVGTMCVCKNNKETGKDFGCTNSKNACDALPGSTGTKCKKCGEAIDFSGGFPCSGSGDITLNRLNSGMYPLYDTFGSNCMLRMSPDQSIGNYATSAFVEYDFAPGTDFAFSSTFGYRIYGDMARSADGLTFVIHQDPNGASALGLGGIDMGVYGGSAAIKNSLVIELDTWKNSDRDDTENHVSIKSIDGAGDVTEYTEVALDEDDLRTEEDGSGSGRVWIEYDGSTIKVYLNSDGDTKPAAPITSHLGFDLSSFFAASTTTYVGFTAGMWAAGDYHDVLDWTFWEAC